jgi:putative NIF3 family GTP cyclohydrolase 1 type 2
MSANFVTTAIAEKGEELETVGDLMEFLLEIPEYAAALKLKAGPKIFAGSAERSLGKVVVTEFTGGTNGSKDIYERMAQYGIGTIVGMHMSEEHRKEAEKHHINVIIAGHMSSDSLGMNLLLDEIEKQGIEVVPISGLIRIKRF